MVNNRKLKENKITQNKTGQPTQNTLYVSTLSIFKLQGIFVRYVAKYEYTITN